MHIGWAKITIMAVIVTLLVLSTAIIHSQTNTTIIKPTPTSAPTASSTPEPKLAEIEVKVTPWGDMYRKEPDCQQDFSVKLYSPNQNASFKTNNFNIVFHTGAFFWIVEKAYYTSDLFSGQRLIEISKTQYTTDLQKTFTFNLTNVPEGSHYLNLTVIFHEGTRNNSTAYFNVNSAVDS
jgi:hypothetical protein